MATTTFSFKTQFQCPFKCHAFCGIPERDRTLSSRDRRTGLRVIPAEDDLQTQFNDFTQNNIDAIKEQKRIVLAPNGSVVPEVPKFGRELVLGYCLTHGYRFESPFAAPLVDQEYTEALYYAEYGKKGRYGELLDSEKRRMAKQVVDEIETALNKDFLP